jgi:hypothetical protein
MRALGERFRTRDEIPWPFIEFERDGRQAWFRPGCGGTTLALGFVRRYDDWVVLDTSECRFGRAPHSAGAFLLREMGDRIVLVPADHSQETELSAD